MSQTFTFGKCASLLGRYLSVALTGTVTGVRWYLAALSKSQSMDAGSLKHRSSYIRGQEIKW